MFSDSTNLNGRIERQQILGAIYNAQGVVYPSYDLKAIHPDYFPIDQKLEKIDDNLNLEFILKNKNN